MRADAAADAGLVVGEPLVNAVDYGEGSIWVSVELPREGGFRWELGPTSRREPPPGKLLTIVSQRRWPLTPSVTDFVEIGQVR
jgi:two-component sensor histidine kinase